MFPRDSFRGQLGGGAGRAAEGTPLEGLGWLGVGAALADKSSAMSQGSCGGMTDRKPYQEILIRLGKS